MPDVAYQVGQKIITNAGRKQYYLVDGKKVSKNPYPYSSSTGSLYDRWEKKKGQVQNEFPIYEWNGTDWVNTGEFGDANVGTRYENIAAVPKAIDVTSTEWGAANITKDDFIDPTTGEQRPIYEIAKILDPKLPNITGAALMAQIKDMAPKYTGVKKADVSTDVYGLQKKASQVGASLKNVYTGSAVGMRERMEGEEALGKGLKRAYETAGEKKEAAYEQELEGFLEKNWFVTPEGGEKKLTTEETWKGYEEQHAAEQAAELAEGQASTTPDFAVAGAEGNQALGGGMNFGSIGNFDWAKGLDALDAANFNPYDITQGKEGGFIHKDGSGIGRNRKFNDETFLDVLTQLPEAGGS